MAKNGFTEILATALKDQEAAHATFLKQVKQSKQSLDKKLDTEIVEDLTNYVPQSDQESQFYQNSLSKGKDSILQMLKETIGAFDVVKGEFPDDKNIKDINTAMEKSLKNLNDEFGKIFHDEFSEAYYSPEDQKKINLQAKGQPNIDQPKSEINQPSAKVSEKIEQYSRRAEKHPSDKQLQEQQAKEEHALGTYINQNIGKIGLLSNKNNALNNTIKAKLEYHFHDLKNLEKGQIDLIKLSGKIKDNIDDLIALKTANNKENHQTIDKYIQHFAKDYEHYNAQRTDLQKDSPSYKFLMNTSTDKLASTMNQGYSAGGEFIDRAASVDHFIANAPSEIINKIVAVQDKIAEKNNQTKFASVKDTVANFCNKLASYVGKGVQDKDFVALQAAITKESGESKKSILSPATSSNVQDTLSTSLAEVKSKLAAFNARVEAKSKDRDASNAKNLASKSGSQAR